MSLLRGLAERGGQLLSRLSNYQSEGTPAPAVDQSASFTPGLPPHNPPPTGGPLSAKVVILGKTVLKKGFVEIGRDGGGGGYVNGKHIVLFSDTLVRGWGPINNTICYSAHDNPVILEDFGEDGVPVQGVPYIDEEKEYTDHGRGKTRVVIWPQSMINALPGDKMRGIGVAPVSIQSAPGAPQPSRELYNTLYTITASDVPTVERTVPKLWHDGSVLYGTFATYLNPQDGMLYFFAAEGGFHTANTGLKVARASLDSYIDKSKWQFWTGDSWVGTPPKAHEAKPIMPNVYSSGDIFFSPYLGTYIAVYFLGTADSTFRYRYALPDKNGKVSLTGKWSEDYILYDSSEIKNGGYGFNFAGHAYPDYDRSGETLILSCTCSDGLTPYFFKATFKR